MGPRAIGYLVLALGLPLAALGILSLPNDHAAAGIAGADCDGPGTVFLFAVPAFMLYAAGAILNGADYRRARSLAIALICLAICAGLSLNLHRAWQEARIVAAEPACR